jgi:hypothetical protein
MVLHSNLRLTLLLQRFPEFLFRQVMRLLALAVSDHLFTISFITDQYWMNINILHEIWTWYCYAWMVVCSLRQGGLCHQEYNKYYFILLLVGIWSVLYFSIQNSVHSTVQLHVIQAYFLVIIYYMLSQVPHSQLRSYVSVAVVHSMSLHRQTWVTNYILSSQWIKDIQI